MKSQKLKLELDALAKEEENIRKNRAQKLDLYKETVKNEIADLFVKFGLLDQGAEVIIGMLLDAQSAIKDSPEKIKSWEAAGSSFLTSKSNKVKKQKSPK